MNRRSFLQRASAFFAAVVAGPKALFSSATKPKLELTKDAEFEVYLDLDYVPSSLLYTYGSVNAVQFKDWSAGTLWAKAYKVDRILTPEQEPSFSISILMAYRKDGWNRVFACDTPEFWDAFDRGDDLPPAQGRWINAPLYAKASFAWLENASISPYVDAPKSRSRG